MKISYVGKQLNKNTGSKSRNEFDVQKKSLLKGGLRAIFKGDTNDLLNAEWYKNYLENEIVEFYIEGSGMYKLMNIDLNDGEFYFEKSNTPVYNKKCIFVDMPFNEEFKNGLLKELKKGINIKDVEVCTIEDLTKSKGAVKLDTQILKEIRNCLLFVADISIIADKDMKGNSRWISNPNVMLELGYALAVKNRDNIFITYNEDKINIDLRNLIPFDIKSYQNKRYKKNNFDDLIKSIILGLNRLGFS